MKLARTLLITFVFILIFSGQVYSQERKSLSLVLESAIAPVLITVPSWIYLDENGLRLGTFLIDTMPMVSHGYLGDNLNGVLYVLAKGIGMVVIYDGLRRYEKDAMTWGEWDRSWEYSEIAVGGALLMGVYTYELVDLVKKTLKINREAEDKVSLGLYPAINRDRINLSVTLTF